MPGLIKVTIDNVAREWNQVWWGTYMDVPEFSVEQLNFFPEEGQVQFKYPTEVMVKDSNNNEVFTGIVGSFTLKPGSTLEIVRPHGTLSIAW